MHAAAWRFGCCDGRRQWSVDAQNVPVSDLLPHVPSLWVLSLWLPRFGLARTTSRKSEHGPSSMRIAAAFVTYMCLAGCSTTPTQSASEHVLTRQDGWR